jgi:hypothetical protein
MDRNKEDIGIKRKKLSSLTHKGYPSYNRSRKTKPNKVRGLKIFAPEIGD